MHGIVPDSDYKKTVLTHSEYEISSMNDHDISKGQWMWHITRDIDHNNTLTDNCDIYIAIIPTDTNNYNN